MAGRHRAGRVGYRDVFAVGEFRALFGAHLLSVIGDQVARVALAVLVFERTGSPGLTALAYALTLLPDLVAGPLLAGLADRFPRRTVMIVCDVLRAGLVALMALPGAPLAAVCALLVLVEVAGAPFAAARAATLPAVLAGELYVLGSAVSNLTFQAALLVGFGVGGPLVAVLGTTPALLLDAATFLLSAALLAAGVRARPVPVLDGAGPPRAGPVADAVAAARFVWRDRWLRGLLALGALSSLYEVKEGLAVPYAAALGGGPALAGALLAVAPAGTAVGMLLLGRVPARARLRWVPALAVAASAPLVLCALQPGAAVTLVLFGVSGLAASYQLVVNAEFVRALPDAWRGQVFGLAATVLRGGHAAGVLLAGVAAESAGPQWPVAVAAALGVVAAVGVSRWAFGAAGPRPVGPTGREPH